MTQSKSSRKSPKRSKHAEAFLRRAVALDRKGNLPTRSRATRRPSALTRSLPRPIVARGRTIRRRKEGRAAGDEPGQGLPRSRAIHSAKADNEAALHKNEAAPCQYDAALRRFTEAIRLDPKCPEGYRRRRAFPDQGTLRRRPGRSDGGDPGSPDDGEALYQRARAALRMGDPDRAIKDCRRAIQLKPTHARAFQQLGVAYWPPRPQTVPGPSLVSRKPSGWTRAWQRKSTVTWPRRTSKWA